MSSLSPWARENSSDTRRGERVRYARMIWFL
jgi:hypothetical protein